MQTQNYANETGFSDSAGADARVRLDQAASKAHETVDRVHRSATAVTERVTTQGERLYQDSCAWISAHPVQAVAGALLAGYLFGKLR